MWDEDDHFGRWVQFFCALFLLAIAVAFGYFGMSEPSYSRTQDTIFGVAIGSLILAVRRLWYAITAKTTSTATTSTDQPPSMGV